MMTRSTLRAAAAAFFVATNLLVCLETQELNVASTSTPSPEIYATSTIATTGIENSRALPFRSAASSLLPPDILSHPDPMAFFLNKLTRNAYNSGRDVLAFTGNKWRAILRNLDPYLEKRKMPRPYIPYARLLSSLLTCLDKLHRVSTGILEIQLKHSVASDYPPPPEGILTPELSGLFSTDVFSDPEIPSVLLNKILKIPDDRIPDVVADLVKLLNEHNYVDQKYYEYMRNLRIFFQNRDDIYKLRLGDADIRRRFQRNKNKTSNAS